jgi:hypothetical protein
VDADSQTGKNVLTARAPERIDRSHSRTGLEVTTSIDRTTAVVFITLTVLLVKHDTSASTQDQTQRGQITSRTTTMTGPTVSEFLAASARHVIVEAHASGEVWSSSDVTVSCVVVGITVVSVVISDHYLVPVLVSEIRDKRRRDRKRVAYLPMHEL